MRRSSIALCVGLVVCFLSGQATSQVSGSPSPGGVTRVARPAPAPVPVPIPKRGAVTTYHTPPPGSPAAVIDFVNAKSLELPAVAPRSDLQAQYDLMDALQARPQLQIEAGFSPGADGDGHMSPIFLGAPAGGAAGEQVAPQESGTTNHPFTTARADLSGATASNAYPYRASGKLFFNIGTATYMCSASLIKRGVVVTAAHCVANFGTNQFYANWRFVPAYSNGVAPYGVWSVRSASVVTAYLDGTDSCAVAGIVCQDDVALLLLNSNAGAYPGTATGWYGWAHDGYGFIGSGIAQITQIGYPVCLDNGAIMERNDSYGYTSGMNASNTIIGSLMCGGSSGGPWLVNFGIRPVLSATAAGTAGDPNVVVGVTSWGYNDGLPKEMGAAPFTSANIVELMNTVCAEVPAACS